MTFYLSKCLRIKIYFLLTVFYDKTMQYFALQTVCYYVSVTPNFFDTRSMGTVGHSRLLWSSGPAHCIKILQHPQVQTLIYSKEHHFDAIIVEAFVNECLLGFAHKFQAAIIQICPFGGTHWMGDWVGNPNPYSYIPDAFLDYSDHMSFWERLVNTIAGVYWRIGQEFYNLPRQDIIMRQFFNYTDSIPPLSEIVRNTSLLLVNNHFSLNYPRPLVPNMIEVGGMHVMPPNQLPQVRQITLQCNVNLVFRVLIVTLTWWYRTRRPKHCDHFRCNVQLGDDELATTRNA
jgi:hypothetical protein